METNKILDADILDIIFDGRNKQYGAYDLRKTYNKRLTTALLVMLGVCLLIVLGSVIAGTGSSKKKATVFVQDVSLADLKEEKKEPPPPPPPPYILQRCLTAYFSIACNKVGNSLCLGKVKLSV